MDFLQLQGKSILVLGVANRKSVAFHVAQLLREAGAEVIYSVRTQSRRQALRETLTTLQPEAEIHVCDVEYPEQIANLVDAISSRHPFLHGIVHSIAWAGYEEGLKPFHEVGKRDFLRAVDISCYSLVAIANAFRGILDRDASVVTISISTTRMASENYGYMAPIKAALDSTVIFLAKSFSQFSHVRFNAVGPGLLKTSASAGIPGYVNSYLYAEQVTLRKQALKTGEVANTVAFLLSPRSSGINAQQIVIDAGMGVNYFDRDVVEKVTRPD